MALGYPCYVSITRSEAQNLANRTEAAYINEF